MYILMILVKCENIADSYLDLTILGNLLLYYILMQCQNAPLLLIIDARTVVRICRSVLCRFVTTKFPPLVKYVSKSNAVLTRANCIHLFTETHTGKKMFLVMKFPHVHKSENSKIRSRLVKVISN
jgi:hypothetical protein